mmetsp:Transcript_59302/g.145011  ORF Transcript_59302/g.145011 Transcript_59302/m.145011 type:complete len:203 (-) Transcript_59302:4486-5094(-)
MRDDTNYDPTLPQAVVILSERRCLIAPDIHQRVCSSHDETTFLICDETRPDPDNLPCPTIPKADDDDSTEQVVDWHSWDGIRSTRNSILLVLNTGIWTNDKTRVDFVSMTTSHERFSILDSLSDNSEIPKPCLTNSLGGQTVRAENLSFKFQSTVLFHYSPHSLQHDYISTVPNFSSTVALLTFGTYDKASRTDGHEIRTDA